MNTVEEKYDHKYEVNEAIKYLCHDNKNNVAKAQNQIEFLVVLGKDWLLRNYTNEDVASQLTSLIKKYEALLDEYQKAKRGCPKAIMLIARNSNIKAINAHILELKENIECLKKTMNKLKKETRGSWITNGVSRKDEFIGICFLVYNEFRPNKAKISEENDFHKFCQSILSLVHEKTYRESLKRSLEKILN